MWVESIQQNHYQQNNLTPTPTKGNIMLFDLTSMEESADLMTGFISEEEGRIRMVRFGACNIKHCSCAGFVYTNDAQWCDNCEHSRSSHQRPS